MDHSDTGEKGGRLQGFTSLSTQHQTRREGDGDGLEDTTPLINRYRQTLASYEKLFHPRANIRTIEVKPVARETMQRDIENQRSEINVEELRFKYPHENAVRNKGEYKGEGNAISSPWKSLTETKNKKRMGLDGMIQSHSKASNLELQIHKQRFFQTFVPRGDRGKSIDKLAGIRKKLILQ